MKKNFFTHILKKHVIFYILDDGLFGRGQEYLKFSAMFKNDVNKSYNCRKVESLQKNKSLQTLNLQLLISTLNVEWTDHFPYSVMPLVYIM